MDIEFFKQQALRARDLAEKADPFTRKRLLALADKYDVKAGGPSKASRMIERPVPLPREWPVSTGGQSGEA
ncbi:hypothetical protein QA641_03885 [Bradyrhizobium sp. CB1650]|uniref:hypothetical protein n=1 Tax=Bradyrhizobium sp. CB1650 TaxID=3039153 RepID=UPI002434AFA8|nr:hypothetical protein [Bradyrhizobium sp. CB1650]WGD53091.1 hypothetical protein QA641_03885 [Bradyrhizobium sp. CB1650]